MWDTLLERLLIDLLDRFVDGVGFLSVVFRFSGLNKSSLGAALLPLLPLRLSGGCCRRRCWCRRPGISGV